MFEPIFTSTAWWAGDGLYFVLSACLHALLSPFNFLVTSPLPVVDMIASTLSTLSWLFLAYLTTWETPAAAKCRGGNFGDVLRPAFPPARTLPLSGRPPNFIQTETVPLAPAPDLALALHLAPALHLRQVQCSAVQCSAMQCSAVQCSAVQCGLHQLPGPGI
jgi:hypothetical protein